METTKVVAADSFHQPLFAENANAVDLVAQLADYGLVGVGLFQVEPPDGPTVVAQVMVDPDGSFYAAVFVSPVEGAYVQVTSRFDDGSALTSTSPTTSDQDEPIDPLALIGLHHQDVAGELIEVGAVTTAVTTDNAGECFADDQERLIESAFEAAPEMAAAGYLQEALSEQGDDDEAAPATRLTAYTDADVTGREFLDQVIGWLAGWGFATTEVSGYALDELDPATPAGVEAWAEVVAEGEAVIEGDGPVPWQAVIDLGSLVEEELVADEMDDVGPFEVSLALDDAEATWINADRLTQMTVELARLTQAIITYCEPFDFGGCVYSDGLEAGAWLQVHSPRCVEQFGEGCYTSAAPVAAIKDLGELGKLVQLALRPASTADLDEAGAAWADHLGDVDLPEWDDTLRLVPAGDVWQEPEAEPWAGDDENDEEPLADRRGVEGFGQWRQTLFVLAEPAAVAEKLGGAVRADVMGTAQTVTSDDVFVYRLAGHAWCGVAACPEGERTVGEAEARQLTAALDTRAIVHLVDPATSGLAFALWESGELVEHFSFGEHAVQPGVGLVRGYMGEALPAYGAGPGQPGLVFASALREVDVDSITDPYAFDDQCFRIQDCYDPSWTFEELLALVTGDPIDPADVPIDPTDVDAMLLVGSGAA